MNRTDLDNILLFAEQHHITNRPFQEVYNLYCKDLEELYQEDAADSWNATMEAHVA